MNRIKDFFYDKNDIIVAFLILAAAAFIIYLRIGDIMSYPDTLLQSTAAQQTTQQTTTSVPTSSQTSAPGTSAAASSETASPSSSAATQTTIAPTSPQ